VWQDSEPNRSRQSCGRYLSRSGCKEPDQGVPRCLSRIHLGLAECRFDLSYMPLFGESPPIRIWSDRIFQHGATSLPKGVTTASESFLELLFTLWQLTATQQSPWSSKVPLQGYFHDVPWITLTGVRQVCHLLPHNPVCSEKAF
jgi:hypothetical protein